MMQNLFYSILLSILLSLVLMNSDLPMSQLFSKNLN
jgi:hypothetical protein